MNLLEHEGKELFAKYKIGIPKGFLASSLEEVRNFSSVAEEFVLKAQIPAGKRGKAGAVLLATGEDVLKKAKGLFSRKIEGFKVEKVLIEEKISAEKELYLSLTVSRSDKSVIALFSEQGGTDVEELAERYPEKIIKKKADEEIRIKDKVLERKLNDLLKRLHKLMLDNDATLVEINPVVLHKNRLVALDAKVVIDDNALFRHPQFRQEAELTDIEKEAAKAGIQYVELDGSIGVIGNGAGLVMTTLDLIAHHKGKPANFLDVGGGADQEMMYKALGICLMNRKVKGVLVNIFGGITRCDEMAQGIIDYKKKSGLRKPVVVRMIGTNEKQAKEMLEKSGIEMHDSMDGCAKRMIELVKR